MVKRDKEGHYMMLKVSIHQEHVTIVNLYVPNFGTPKYIKQILTELKRKINSNRILVGDFNSSLSTIDHPEGESVTKQCI